ncbi:methyltransferase domain-containing protein [Actibacterium pelagium]|uniref:Malonyl-[acyl-carrier protein] O-methyltransferase n=1 Tax=Actibacterium pelagium TaxID=2029103 RepID=A0A917AI82_9RHOB|nr:methyltransferase domain-containing protein [Actibacterium pelagium]GGE55040.1 malonyl-[acyl-carrier protein] O-methyltransferase [Actibacterium pelagium]
MNQDRVAQSFRRGLASYGRAAQVQKDGTSRLLDLFALVSTQTRFAQALEFGCGTGFLTRALLSRFEIGELTLNDLLPEAVERTQDSLTDKTTALPGPIEELALPASLDLIASAATVQWIEDQQSLLQKLSEALAPGGWLLLSGFGPGHFTELQSLGLTKFNDSFRDPNAWKGILPDGLQPVTVQMESHVLQLSSPHSVLMHLRQTGVNGAVGAQWTKSRLRDFEARYIAEYSTDHGVTLTYQPVYVIARKRAPKA